MPHIKNALIRYRIIDKCIRNKYNPFPSKQDLREACEDSLYGSIDGAHICNSTIEKDMYAMTMEHDAPIKYSKRERGYFYEDPDFTINNIPLTDNDMEAISFAAKTLMQFKDVELFRQFGNAIDKIVDHVAVSQDQDAQQFVQFEAAVADGGNEYLTSILEALKIKRYITFDYASTQNAYPCRFLCECGSKSCRVDIGDRVRRLPDTRRDNRMRLAERQSVLAHDGVRQLGHRDEVLAGPGAQSLEIEFRRI